MIKTYTYMIIGLNITETDQLNMYPVPVAPDNHNPTNK